MMNRHNTMAGRTLLLTMITVAGIVLFLMALSSFGAAEDDVTISGTVYDKDTNDPIEGADVNLHNQDSEEGRNTKSGVEGKYQITTTEGNINFWATKDGYHDYATEFKASKGEQKELDIYLQAKPPKDAKIYGKVTDKDTEEPLEGADVNVWNKDTEEYDSTRTDANGDYEIWTAEGNVDLGISMENYYRYDNSFYISAKEERKEDVALQAKPPKDAKIYGTVTDKDTEEPLDDASVNLWNQDTEENEYTRTDETGYYEVWTAEGQIDFYVDMQDYKQFTDNFYIDAKDEKNVDAYLEPKAEETARVFGYVYEKDGGRSDTPIADVGVYIYNQDEDQNNGTQTDENGYYEMMAAPGKVEINTYHEDYKHFHDEFTLEEKEEKEFAIYLVKKAEETARVFGYVYEKDEGRSDTPIAGVGVNIYNHDEDQWNGTETDENGYFEMRAAPGDMVEINTNHEDYKSYHEEFSLADKEEKEFAIYLEEKPPEDSTVYGYVYEKSYTRNDQPLEGIDVGLYNEDTGTFNQTQTDKNGYYEMRTAEGPQVHIFIEEEGYDDYHTMFSVGNKEERQEDVTLFPQNTLLKGYVYGETDGRAEEPIDNAQVSVHNRDTHANNDSWTDDTGYYEIWVAEGELEFNIFADGFFDYHDQFFVEHDKEYDQGTFTLEEKTPMDSVMKGFVKDVDGVPLEGIIIMVQSFTDFAGRIDNDTQTDATGYYEVGFYGGGPIFQAAFDQNGDYHNVFQFIVVEDNDTELDKDFTLYAVRENKATVKGFIKDDAGNPLEEVSVKLSGTYIGINIGGDDGDGPGWPYQAWTDDTGYYEFDAPVSAMSRADDEEFYLVAEHNESHGEVKEVTLVEGDNDFDFTLTEPDITNEINVYLYPRETGGDKEPWTDGYVQFKQPFAIEGSWQTTRVFIDFIMGNKDGSVDGAEEERFLAWLNFMASNDDDGGGGGEMTDTEDDFYVDDIYYEFEDGGFMAGDFIGMKGPIDDGGIIVQNMDTNVTAMEKIEQLQTHNILFNVSYSDKEGDEEEDFVIHLPDGFALFGAEHTDNVSVEEEDSSRAGLRAIRVKYIGDVFGDDLWEMVNITVISKLMGHIERTDDPGNMHVMEGSSAAFLAQYINPEDLTIERVFWNFGDGPASENDLEPSYIWADNGEYTVEFVVETDTQQYTLATMTMMVDNALPVVDAGKDLTDIPAGEAEDLDGSFTDAGALDTHTIIWTAEDSRATKSSEYVVFADNSKLETAVTFTKAGSYTLRLTVTDDDGGVGSATITVTVKNDPPKAQFDNLNDDSVVFGIFAIEVSDEDGAEDIVSAKLEYSKDGTNWVSIGVDNTPADGFTVNWDTTPAGITDGTYTLKVTLTDGSEETNSKEISVEVNNSLPPTLKVWVEPGEDKTVLSWSLPDGSKVPDIAKFVKYHIYRESANFTETDGLTPFMTIDVGGSAPEDFEIKDMVFGDIFYFAVTIEDKDGNQNTDVAPTMYEAAKLALDEVKIVLSDDGEPEPNKPLRITVEVENIGGDYARSISVEVYVDDNLQEIIGPFTIAPGDKESQTSEWKTEEGQHTIKIVVIYGDGQQHELTQTITVSADETDSPGFEAVSLGLVFLATAFVVARRKRL